MRIKNQAGNWVEGQPAHGQPYQFSNDFGGWVTVAAYHYPESDKIRAQRDQLIEDTLWMYERLAREMRLALNLTYTQSQLDIYVQALADITEQPGFPESVVWPTL